jgi:hypothetical protein
MLQGWTGRKWIKVRNGLIYASRARHGGDKSKTHLLAGKLNQGLARLVVMCVLGSAEVEDEKEGWGPFHPAVLGG